MPSQKDLDKQNQASLSSQRRSRDARDVEREIRKAERAALQVASSTKQRRQIKASSDRAMEQFNTTSKQEGGIYDLSTNAENPKTPHPDTGRRNLQDDGVDFVSRERIPEDETGGLPDGYEETEVILCQNGSPVDGFILFKLA